jgi:hypothetical protein
MQSQKQDGDDMNFNEIREISVIVPVSSGEFGDDKEVIELFEYVYKKNSLYVISHFPLNFKPQFMNDEKVFVFTLRVREGDKLLESRKDEIELLINSYTIHEHEYIRFRKFGEIESHMLMRK